MKIEQYALSLQQLPVDLFADPDGALSYEALVAAAGFDPNVEPAPVVAALAEPWAGHPDGAAVVAGSHEGLSLVVVIECDEPSRRAA